MKMYLICVRILKNLINQFIWVKIKYAETIEQKCLSKGVKLTDQRRIIAKVISESKAEYGESDHPDVDELTTVFQKLIQK